ncbi:MAG TPA: hypothetical protein VH479_16590 [Acidimicrobiales bacterium]
MTAPTAPLPEDTSLAAVLEDFDDAGFSAILMATDGGVLCAVCRSVVEPADLLVQRLRRLEGASDPSDMLAVVGATCPGCHLDGTLLLSYGPDSDAAHADVLAGLDVPAAVDAAGPAPGEVWRWLS